MRRRAAGFTLIEVLAVVLLTGIVLGVALDFYLDLSRASNRAADNTRETRRTAAVLDRMARDLENTVFLKKPDALDPLAHPWIFLAEEAAPELGAERLKFVTRGHDPRAQRGARVGSRGRDLHAAPRRGRRASSCGARRPPGSPRASTASFPARGSPGDVAARRGRRRLRRRLPRRRAPAQDQLGLLQLVEESELPAAVEIQLAMTEPGPRRGARGARDPTPLGAPPRASARSRGDVRRRAGDEEEEDAGQDGVRLHRLRDARGEPVRRPPGRADRPASPSRSGSKMLPTSIRKQVKPECL